MTIDQIVKVVKPDYVAINNPREKGVPTLGTTEVEKVEIDFDKADGVCMYVTIV